MDKIDPFLAAIEEKENRAEGNGEASSRRIILEFIYEGQWYYRNG